MCLEVPRDRRFLCVALVALGGPTGIELAPLTLCWFASFLLRKLGSKDCRDARHYVVRSNPSSLCSERGFRPCRKAITPTLWERAGVMADRQGFEPWIPSLVYSLSRGALSTTQPSVLNDGSAGDGRSWNISRGFRQEVNSGISKKMGSGRVVAEMAQG